MDAQRKVIAVILAAGDGKRMKSDRPKVLCEVLFMPMIRWVETACRKAGIEDIYIVTGNHAEMVRAAVSEGCHFVCQAKRLGTGHAVMMAADAIAQAQDVLVLNGDAPFITAELIMQAYGQHREQGYAATLFCAELENPYGYGRVLRGQDGRVRGIVEQKDASPKQRAIRQVNAGAYWFDAAFLARALSMLTPANVQKEYYLTDTIGIAVQEGLRVGGFVCPEQTAVLGANDRAQLLELNEIARKMVLRRHLENGVEIPCADGVIIGPEVEIEHDACILPGSILKGRTKIGAHAQIGPNSWLVDSQVGEGTKILSSWLTDSSVGKNATIGPFSQLRPNSHLGDGVKIGDFVEVKNSTIGDKTSIAHLTYLGDSDVGEECNFGCGVVTANYNGKKKFRTKIGDRAFIGCNTNLIPPVQVGDGAYTAAGTTIDRDVPDGAMAIGRVRQEIKEGWADSRIRFKGGSHKTDADK